MGFISNVKEAREGVRKARRDIDLAKAFFAEHNDNPPFDVAERFFSALGNDVDGSKPREVRAYMFTIGKFQRQWLNEHPNGVSTNDSPDISISVVAVPLAFDGDKPDPVTIMKIVRDMLMQDSNYRAGVEQAQAMNREAGYCLGCGGGLDEDGACDGTGDEDWDGTPETAKGNPANRVSETAPLTSEQKVAKITQLRARLDQLLAEYKELRGHSPEAQAELTKIMAEIEALEASK
jgi:hypothetical protein